MIGIREGVLATERANEMTGLIEGQVRVFLQLYNDQPKFVDLPAEDAARFAALETLCTYRCVL